MKYHSINWKKEYKKMTRKKRNILIIMVIVVALVAIITLVAINNKDQDYSEGDYNYSESDNGIEEISDNTSESSEAETDDCTEETSEAETETDGEFVYTKLDDGTWEIYEYIGEASEVIIPDSWLGTKVTRIGEYCFLDSVVSYVYIPDTVTSVGKDAFALCIDVTISGGKNLEVIEASAFEHCIFDEDFTFSENLTSIGYSAFYNAQGINNIELGEKVEYIGPEAFDSFGNTELIDISIPDTVKVIGVNALRRTKISEDLADYAICGDNVLIHFPNEETVIVPEGVKVVSDTGRKRKCIIKEMYIPDTVTYICGNLIENCTDLKIYIPSSVEGIGTIENYKIAYECIGEITFVVESGSYAESYAIENNINYEIVDSVQALYEAAVASESGQ
jgi:hypothetical protein